MPLLEKLFPKEVLYGLSQIADLCYHKPNDVIYQNYGRGARLPTDLDAPGYSLYLILSGEVDIGIDLMSRRTTIQKLHKNDSFGEYDFIVGHQVACPPSQKKNYAFQIPPRLLLLVESL